MGKQERFEQQAVTDFIKKKKTIDEILSKEDFDPHCPEGAAKIMDIVDAVVDASEYCNPYMYARVRRYCIMYTEEKSKEEE